VFPDPHPSENLPGDLHHGGPLRRYLQLYSVDNHAHSLPRGFHQRGPLGRYLRTLVWMTVPNPSFMVSTIRDPLGESHDLHDKTHTPGTSPWFQPWSNPQALSKSRKRSSHRHRPTRMLLGDHCCLFGLDSNVDKGWLAYLLAIRSMMILLCSGRLVSNHRVRFCPDSAGGHHEKFD